MQLEKHFTLMRSTLLQPAHPNCIIVLEGCASTRNIAIGVEVLVICRVISIAFRDVAGRRPLKRLEREVLIKRALESFDLLLLGLLPQVSVVGIFSLGR